MNMTVAAIQLNATENTFENTRKAVSMIRKAVAQKATLIVLPEMFNYRKQTKESRGYVEAIPGESILPLMALAKELECFIVAGSICEEIEGESRGYNTSILIDSKGEITATYRKIHLFNVGFEDAKISESNWYRGGDVPAMGDVNGVLIGLSICYDLRFPELYRLYSQKGVKILTVPSSFLTKTGQDHWEVLLRARAIENQCFVIAPNQTGQGAGVETYGNSMIIDPWGSILKRGSKDQEEVLVETLDFNRQDTIQSSLPSLKHRKL